MSHEIVCFSAPKNLRKKVDGVRGDTPRSKFITRAIEAYINRILSNPVTKESDG